MCPFIETIRIENGVVENLQYHTERFNRTRSAHWNNSVPLNLADFIHPPTGEGVMKCRMVYSEAIEEVTYTPYTVRPIGSLRLVAANDIDYSYKSTDREALNRLFAQREAADDVLIVRNGLLTDTSIANIALYDGTTWFTPTTPLLQGTRRAALLDEGKIVERTITLDPLFGYSHLTLFNAMIPFEKFILPIHQGSVVV